MSAGQFFCIAACLLYAGFMVLIWGYNIYEQLKRIADALEREQSD